jgi:hypothetical protein
MLMVDESMILSDMENIVLCPCCSQTLETADVLKLNMLLCYESSFFFVA